MYSMQLQREMATTASLIATDIQSVHLGASTGGGLATTRGPRTVTLARRQLVGCEGRRSS